MQNAVRSRNFVARRDRRAVLNPIQVQDPGITVIRRGGVIPHAIAERRRSENRVVVGGCLGGFEIGGIAGLILGCAAMRKPVLIDGLISTAGALIAHGLAPAAADYMVASHRSVEQGHTIALEHLNKAPLLDLDLRLGEGTGAALAMPLVESAVRILTEVATFEEASVSQAEE